VLTPGGLLGGPQILHHYEPIPRDTVKSFAKIAINNTLVIVPVNSGMMYWVDNLMCSLSLNTDFDTKKILFWALDAEAQITLTTRGYTAYYDPALYHVSTNENTHGATHNYERMMRQRPVFFIDILAAGYDMLLIDADIVWYQSPMLLRDPSVDAVFSTDSRDWYQEHDAFKDSYRRGDRMPPICGGLFWMKSSERTIRLYRDMLDVFESTSWFTAIWQYALFQDDQRGMDWLLNDGRARLVAPLPDGITEKMVQGRFIGNEELEVRLADQTTFVSGHLFKNKRERYLENLAALRKSGEERASVHLNWYNKIDTKEEGARAMGLWYLDEEGKCRAP